MKSNAKTVELLKVVSDPSRFSILQLLVNSGNRLCVNGFVKKMNLTQPTISGHLKVLREAGLVETYREGIHIHYSMNIETFQPVVDMLSDLTVIKPKKHCGSRKCRKQ